jgi:hypothetical protein
MNYCMNYRAWLLLSSGIFLNFYFNNIMYVIYKLIQIEVIVKI